jgi:hypothetical protein
MLINKIGFDHILNGTNCQDFGLEIKDINKSIYIGNIDNIINLKKLKCVVDGCGEGENSEIGAKLFCLSLQNNLINMDIKNFKDILHKSFLDTIKILDINNKTDDEYKIKVIKNYFCFTILIVLETENDFITFECGDGYIIKQTHNDDITFDKIDYGVAPKYYAYNFINEQYLQQYKEKVDFTINIYKKEDYKNIGIATDGLRFILQDTTFFKFSQFLILGKEVVIKRRINLANSFDIKLDNGNIRYRDDITICF